MFDFIREYLRDRRRNRAWDRAYALAKQYKFDEAAAVYEDLSVETLTYNKMLYVSDCHQAMQYRLQAKNSDRALQLAQKALNAVSDSKIYLEYEVDTLSKMVAEFELAGCNTEAAAFAPQVNELLETHQIPLRVLLQEAAIQPASETESADECPQCSAVFPLTAEGEGIKCSYCEYIVEDR